MKKIIIILALVLAVNEIFAQAPTPPPPYSPMTSPFYWFKSQAAVDGLFYVGYGDTLVSGTPYRAGALKFWLHPAVDTALWVYNGTKWNKITGGGGSSSDIIIDTTLTLTGNLAVLTIPHGLGVVPIIVSVNQDQGEAYNNFITDADDTNIYITYSAGQIISNITYTITLRLQ